MEDTSFSLNPTLFSREIKKGGREEKESALPHLPVSGPAFCVPPPHYSELHSGVLTACVRGRQGVSQDEGGGPLYYICCSVFPQSPAGPQRSAAESRCMRTGEDRSSPPHTHTHTHSLVPPFTTNPLSPLTPHSMQCSTEERSV